MSRPFVGIGVPLVVRFGPADVGRRVTLRRRLLDAEPGGPTLGDVVGVLEGWETGALTVRRRTGELVTVPEITLVAGRVVAPERSAQDVSLSADDSWRAHETAALGAWRLRAHAGLTHRANSALAVGDPGMSMLDTAAAVRRWYRERALTPTVMTPLPSPVAAAYRAMGWQEEARSVVLAAPVPDLLAATAAESVALDGARVELAEAPPADWSLVLAPLRDPAAAPLFGELLSATPTAAFATVRDSDGSPLGIARGAISDGWLNLTTVEVVEPARGRRLAVAAVAALTRWADEAGAMHAYLQTRPENTAAVRLYTRLGLTPHHEYAYFVAAED